MSVEHQSAKDKLAQVLADRYSRLSRRWEASTPGKRQAALEEILAARFVAARFPDIITALDAQFLLQLDDPLQAVADQWLEVTGLNRSQDDILVQCVGTLRDNTLQQSDRHAAKKPKSPRRDSMAR